MMGNLKLKTEGHTGNAAEIATVGWGSDNLWVNDGATAKNKTAGTLYIGTYGEPINYGKSFASRPLGVKFWYKYYSYNNETTTPYVEVYGDNQEVIGSGSLLINASNYEFKSGYIPIDYPVAKKAKSITIVFSSTDSKNPETKAVQGDAGDFSGNLDSRHIGSILTVDDVENQFMNKIKSRYMKKIFFICFTLLASTLFFCACHSESIPGQHCEHERRVETVYPESRSGYGC